MKRIFTLTVLLLALFVTACGAEKSSPASDVEIICKAYLYKDESALKKIGISAEEYEKHFVAGFSRSFTESSGINFTNQQVIKVNDAFQELLKRSKFKTEVVSENGDNATVKVTVSVFEQITEDKFFGKVPANIDAMSEAEKMDVVINALVAIIKELQIVGDTNLTVDCKYSANDNMWIPLNPEKFGENLSVKILGY